MAEPTGSTALASAVFLRIADFANRPVAAQAQLKEVLEALVRADIAPLAHGDRIVLEAADGLAIVVLGAADAALDIGEHILRKAPQALALRIGINYGPVKLETDARGEPQLLGDGLEVAARIAALAAPGQLFASRAYRDALAAVDRRRAESLQGLGTFTDTLVRAHEVYAPDARARAARRRNVFLFGAFGVTAVLGIGVAARAARHVYARRVRQPAVIDLEIAPAGEIRLDGESKGRSPPLRRIEVAPGTHTIEVLAPGHAPVTLNVNLAPGERIAVWHEFPAPQAPKSAPEKAERPSRLREFFRSLGKEAEPKP
jgi:hypothetical protein